MSFDDDEAARFREFLRRAPPTYIGYEALNVAPPAKGVLMFEDDEETTEAHERRITRCRSCRARIVFLTTDAGRKMPIDADSVLPSDEFFDPPRHESHFATCPNAAQHRASRR